MSEDVTAAESADEDLALQACADEADRARKRRDTPGFKERSPEDRRPGDQDALRLADMALLRDLLDDAEITVGEAGAFDEMLRGLRRGRPPLSKRQRAWAERVARRVGVTVGDPAKRNERVPRGADVEPPPVLSAGSVRGALEARERARRRAAEKARA
jgi:hypothetical protein